MKDQIAVVGNIATDPTSSTLPSGTAALSFRLATNHRRFDREKDAYVEEAANFYSVSAYRSLAANGALSLAKGMRVVVCGRLRVRSWDNDRGKGTGIEIIADAIGIDLQFATASVSRNSFAGSDSRGQRDTRDDSAVDEASSDAAWEVVTVPEGEPAATPF
ncbi:single-stranded DNA-binding protein [Microbacterium sp. KNMS]